MFKRLTRKQLYMLTSGLFVLMVLANVFAGKGWLFPMSMTALDQIYDSLMIPAGFTYLIWPLVYFGMSLALLLPFWPRSWDRLQVFWLEALLPSYSLVFALNIIWLILWTNQHLALALVTIAFYSAILVRLLQRLGRVSNLNQMIRWTIAYPIGLHLGWVLFVSVVCAMGLFIRLGLPPYAFRAMGVSLLLLIAVFSLVLYFYQLNENHAIPAALLWAYLGIFARQRTLIGHRGGHFFIMLVAFLLFLGLLLLTLRYYRYLRR